VYIDPMTGSNKDNNFMHSHDSAKLNELVIHAIEHATHLLPAQGPITTFVHHNPLHHFENIKFEKALQQFHPIYGNQMLLGEQRFRKEMDAGRILAEDIRCLLKEDLGNSASEEIAPGFSKFDLRWQLLNQRHFPASAQEVCWLVSNFSLGNESNSSRAILSAPEMNTLFNKCLSFAANTHKPNHHAGSLRHRDILKSKTGIDSDFLVHEVLIRFCSLYLDQGFGIWNLPSKNQGFLKAFSNLAGSNSLGFGIWAIKLGSILKNMESRNLDAVGIIRETLLHLGIQPDDFESYLENSLLALRGWAGMIHQLESRPDKVPHPIPSNSLVEFLAVRLLMDQLALEYLLKRSTTLKNISLSQLWEMRQNHAAEEALSQNHLLAWELFSLLITNRQENRNFLSEMHWGAILKECMEFDGFQRRFLLQKAYEKKLYDQFLSSLHANDLSKDSKQISFQAIFCIDEREESLRRHLEELDPCAETWSGAGFFGIPMYYKGENESFYAPLCPVVITPSKWVREVPFGEISKVHRSRTRTMHTLQRARHEFHVGSRKFSMGTILANTMGYLAGIPLALNILFPNFFRKLKTRLATFRDEKQPTRLTLERQQDPPDKKDGHFGFSLAELASMSERFLRDIGLTKNFSRLVIILGHGSTSVNNPHLSAYDCGACGGSPGGANARALAQTLNDPRVRQIMNANGLNIPESTRFLGGLHNTCNNEIDYFDLDLLPKSHQEDFFKAKYSLEEASKRNAHERCRRFMSAPFGMSFQKAKNHVEGRSADLAQPRPELGHATNAFCLVGRRSRSKNIFMDRRAFLVSYDPMQDNEDRETLARILGAVIPVCSGINLEFFFSQVDQTGWGCGTKLPHNPTSMLGVMDGAASDLRTGLPRQVIEIHEAVRILFVLESTPEGITKVLDRSTQLANICYNGWIRMALLDPASKKMWILQGKDFIPYEPTRTQVPMALSSLKWYAGHREDLDFALLKSDSQTIPSQGIVT